jgi:hypothetical protein
MKVQWFWYWKNTIRHGRGSVASQIKAQDLWVSSQRTMPQNKTSFSDDNLGEETDK